jgi:hypothetical protein
MLGGNLNAPNLFKNDAQLKNLEFDKYSKIASDDAVQRTKDALAAKTFKVDVVNSGSEAVELLKSLIPQGVSVHNGASTTLVRIE